LQNKANFPKPLQRFMKKLSSVTANCRLSPEVPSIIAGCENQVEREGVSLSA
jgi:hypothetical protein